MSPGPRRPRGPGQARRASRRTTTSPSRPTSTIAPPGAASRPNVVGWASVSLVNDAFCGAGGTGEVAVAEQLLHPGHQRVGRPGGAAAAAGHQCGVLLAGEEHVARPLRQARERGRAVGGPRADLDRGVAHPALVDALHVDVVRRGRGARLLRRGRPGHRAAEHVIGAPHLVGHLGARAGGGVRRCGGLHRDRCEHHRGPREDQGGEGAPGGGEAGGADRGAHPPIETDHRSNTPASTRATPSSSCPGATWPAASVTVGCASAMA